MPERKLAELIARFFEEMAEDLLRERVIQYIIRELRNGRKLQDILKDPYVTNRIPEERLSEVLSNSELIDTLEKEIRKTFEEDLNIFD